VTSAAVTVKVRPKVVLTRLSLRHFRVSVSAAESFVGKFVVFQRYVAATAKWSSVKSVQLKVMLQSAAPLPATIVSSSSFTVRLKAGYRVRAILAPSQVGTTYLAASSSVIRS